MLAFSGFGKLYWSPMDAATKQVLAEGARSLGVTLDSVAVSKLERYLELLLLWNRKINLTAITDPTEVVVRHFLDSLAVAAALDPATDTLVDVGAGAGFPGAVVAIALPHLQVTSIESIQKKVAFLQTLRTELAPNLTPRWGRLEEIRQEAPTFAAAVSRATFDPAVWVVEGAPLVRPGGLLIAMLSSEQPEVSPPAGFEALEPRTYRIGDISRRLALFRRSSS